MRLSKPVCGAAVVYLVISVLGCGPLPPGQEYLGPEVRAKVEKLKADVAAAPSTPETVNQRAAVLWDWMNAYALRGGVVPVELPSVMASVLGWSGDAPISVGILVAVDRFVRELEIRDECPDCIGTLSNDAAEPLPSGSYQTLVQTYTVGSMGMKPGGGIMLAQQFLADNAGVQREDPTLENYLGPAGINPAMFARLARKWMAGESRFQRDDPAADNYVSISCSNPEASFGNATRPMTGMHGGFLSGAFEAMVFRLEGPELEEGDTITITYGDASGGSRGMSVQTYANDFFPLPVYVDLTGTDDFFTLPTVPYQIRGTEAFAVHGFAPSVVGVGEPFQVSVRTEDLLYNRATVGIPEYEVLVNGEPHSRIPADEDGLTVLEDLSFSEPGVYRFSFRSPDGTVTGESNPIWVRDDPGPRIYWGELHAHGGFAEGLGTPEWFFRFAREDARLDFVSLSEHDLWMDDSEWEQLMEHVAGNSRDDGFIAYLGYEWTMRSLKGGHHNVFFRTPDGRRRVPVQTAPTLSDLYFQLRQANDLEDVLIIPHCHEPGDWRMSDPDLERLIEIMSMHGHFEWFGQRYVNRGYQMGFIAGSDDHLSHPGYTGTMARGLFQRGGLTAVLATEKTADAIFDSLRDIAAYATTGERIILDVDLNGEPMGSRTEFAEERRFEGRVIGTAPIDTITVVKNGEDVWSEDYLTAGGGRSGFVEVAFFSPSEEFFRESPRGYRYWTGTLGVEGAQLVSFDTPQFKNRYSEFANRDPSSPNRLLFATGTRGKASSIHLELENVTPGAVITLELDAQTEIQSTGQMYRRPAETPRATVRLPLTGARAGLLRREFKVDRYTDSITLRFIEPDAPADRTFEYVDRDPVSRGDYYYVRVKQLDGAMAWSSPIWVGGVPPT